MTALGIAVTALTASVLVFEFLRHKRASFLAYGWLGIAILINAECLMFRGVAPFATYFTPVAWTAYLLLADAAVFAVSGRSRLHRSVKQLVGQLAKVAAVYVHNPAVVRYRVIDLLRQLVELYPAHIWKEGLPGVSASAAESLDH